MDVREGNVVAVLADLAPSFVGEPSPLARPFGRAPSLLRATVTRALAARVGRVAVCYRDTPANQPIAQLVAGCDIDLIVSPAGTNDAAVVVATLATTGARDALAIDAHWPFVSATVMRAQLAHHRDTDSELTFAGMAATGLAGVVVRHDAADRLARAFARTLGLAFDSTLFDCCDNVRSMFATADAAVPPELICMPISLVCRTPDDSDRLSAFDLGPTSENYAGVFAAECRAAWPERIPHRQVSGRSKVLFTAYTTSGEPGSTVAFAILLDHWDREKYDAVIALPNRGKLYDHVAPRFRMRTLPVQWLAPTTNHRWMADVRACTELLADERPDLVYVNGTIAPMAVACRALGIACIAHLHIPILQLGPHVSAVLSRRACVPLYDAIIAPARTAADRLRAAFRPPIGRVTAIECGISTASFDPARHARAEARAQLGIPPDARVIGAVGMLIPLKQPHLAIETLAKVPGAVLVFAGTERVLTGYAQQLEKLAAEHGVADRVKLLGHVDDMGAVYAAIDVLLHCAIGDAFPLVILEAMAMGKPVVALADGGATESVADGVTGRLVPLPGSAAAFAAALVDVLGNPALATRLGTAGRARAIELYDAGRYAARIQRVCDRVLAGEPLE